MIELYKFYVKMYWKNAVFFLAAIICLTLLGTPQNVIDAEGYSHFSITGMLLVFSSLYFYKSFASVAPDEMGIDTLALLPIDRKELGYARYLLPLTLSSAMLLAFGIFAAVKMDFSQFLSSLSTMVAYFLGGLCLLAIRYSISNRLNDADRKSNKYTLIIGFVTIIVLLSVTDGSGVSVLTLLAMAVVAACLVWFELQSFEKYRTFRLG